MLAMGCTPECDEMRNELATLRAREICFLRRRVAVLETELANVTVDGLTARALLREEVERLRGLLEECSTRRDDR